MRKTCEFCVHRDNDYCCLNEIKVKEWDTCEEWDDIEAYPELKEKK